MLPLHHLAWVRSPLCALGLGLASAGFTLAVQSATPALDPKPVRTVQAAAPLPTVALVVISSHPHPESASPRPKPPSRHSRGLLDLQPASGLPVSMSIQISGRRFPRDSSIAVLIGTRSYSQTFASTIAKTGHHGKFKTALRIPALPTGIYEVLARPIHPVESGFIASPFRVKLRDELSARYAPREGGEVFVRGSGYLPTVGVTVVLESLEGSRIGQTNVKPTASGSFETHIPGQSLQAGQYSVLSEQSANPAVERARCVLAVLY